MGDLILISSWNLQWEAVTVTSSTSSVIPESLTMGTRTGIGGFCALWLNSYLKLRSRRFIFLLALLADLACQSQKGVRGGTQE